MSGLTTTCQSCHITQLFKVEPFDSKRTLSNMVGYQRSSNSSQSVLLPRIAIAVSTAAGLVHAIMPSS